MTAHRNKSKMNDDSTGGGRIILAMLSAFSGVLVGAAMSGQPFASILILGALVLGVVTGWFGRGLNA